MSRESTREAEAEGETEGKSEAETADGVREVLVVGGGVAGLTAALFTARAGMDTLVVDRGESILRRNAHLENVPGFPAGVNPRLFVDMLGAQATRNGADRRTGRVVALARAGDEQEGEREGENDGADGPRFVAEIADGGDSGGVDGGNGGDGGDDASGRTRIAAERVVVASWSDAAYLDDLPVDLREAGSKRYVETDDLGRSSVEGLYAAGRIAERYHQSVIAAGDGAEVAITLVHDSETPFYNDWVAPEGYFTDRGREVPPGCEEIDGTEREVRERESMAAMREYFSEPHSERQRTHPSLVDDELGRLPEE